MKNSFLVLLMFFCVNLASPQEENSTNAIIKYDDQHDIEPVDLDESQIKQYRTQEDFQYIDFVKEETWWSRFKQWINTKYNQFLSRLFGEYEPNSFLGFIIQIIPYLLLIVLLSLIVWLFSRLNPGQRMLEETQNGQVLMQEEEDLIRNEDLNSLIRDAIRNGEYRLAIRYYYLNELKKLDRLKIIEYEFQKTNLDYLIELKDSTLHRHFLEITKLYELIWYGSFQVQEKDFRLVEKVFLKMDSELNTGKFE